MKRWGWVALAALLAGCSNEKTKLEAEWKKTEADAIAWKGVAEHRDAQRRGREAWYAAYTVRIATVHRDYGTT